MNLSILNKKLVRKSGRKCWSLQPFNEYSPGLATKTQEPFGSVSLVLNYFVILYYAFLIESYLLLIRKILFQMADSKRKWTFTNEMQEKYPCFRKGRNDYGENAWFANQKLIYLSCTKLMVI